MIKVKGQYDEETQQLFGTITDEIDNMKDKLLNQLAEMLNDGNPGLTEFITPKNAAKLLGISMPTLHRYSEQGILKRYRLGNKTYYRYQDLINSIKLENGGLSHE